MTRASIRCTKTTVKERQRDGRAGCACRFSSAATRLSLAPLDPLSLILQSLARARHSRACVYLLFFHRPRDLTDEHNVVISSHRAPPSGCLFEHVGEAVFEEEWPMARRTGAVRLCRSVQGVGHPGETATGAGTSRKRDLRPKDWLSSRLELQSTVSSSACRESSMFLWSALGRSFELPLAVTSCVAAPPFQVVTQLSASAQRSAFKFPLLQTAHVCAAPLVHKFV